MSIYKYIYVWMSLKVLRMEKNDKYTSLNELCLFITIIII